MPTVFITNKTMTVINKGKIEIVDLNTDLGKECLIAYQDDDIDDIIFMINEDKILGDDVEESTTGNILIEGVELEVDLANKVRQFKNENVPFDHLLKFAERVKDNPSFNSRKMLYKFLEHNGHPITKTGTFLAYKKVTHDFKDLHTKSFDNSIGNVVEMDRNLVDDNPNNTCSSGLHVASFGYAKDFGNGKLLLVEVAPEDVVSVPVDYKGTKMRTSRYTVLSEVNEELDGLIVEDRDESFEEDWSIDYDGSLYW